MSDMSGVVSKVHSEKMYPLKETSLAATIILSGPIPWVSMVPQESPLRRNPTLVSLVSSLELKAALPTRSGAHNHITLDRLRTSGIPEVYRCLVDFVSLRLEGVVDGCGQACCRLPVR